MTTTDKNTDVTRQLPIVDLRLFAGTAEEKAKALNEFRKIMREVGCFYMVGHGIPDTQIQEILKLSREFFALPESEKLSIDIANSPHFRGYTPVGHELTNGKNDWREQLDFNFEATAIPQEKQKNPWDRLRGPNQWPSSLPHFRPIVEKWQNSCAQLSIKLLEIFALALEQDTQTFIETFSGYTPQHHLKIIRYPGRDVAQSEQGVGAHKDSEIISLVLQEKTAGLQAQTSAGWLDAPPLENSFVVNIGETLELASNGYLHATVHRVVAPPAGQDRLSLAFFLAPQLDLKVPVLKLKPELAAQALGPATDPHNPLLHHVGLNTLKGRLRSHPETTKRFYSDIKIEEYFQKVTY